MKDYSARGLAWLALFALNVHAMATEQPSSNSFWTWIVLTATTLSLLCCAGNLIAAFVQSVRHP